MDSPSERRSGFSLFDRFYNYQDSLRPADRLIFGLLLLVFVVSAGWSIFSLAQNLLMKVPTNGGVLVEGVVGSPRFINPVLAITRADYDMVALTHSGLLRLSPDGELVNDLAESVTISEDGRVYNVIMKQDRRWHDGAPVTAADVAYTISLIQKPDLKSPLRGNWSGVTVELIGDYELNFVLENAYTPFQENLTVGILPKHIWDTLSDEELPLSQHNIEPIGSGPYQIEEVKRNPAGLISEYILRISPEYDTGANIERVIVKFYQNEEAVVEALREGEINATAALSERWLGSLNQDRFNHISESLPRVFSIFFNQNKSPVVRDLAVREALNVVIDREELLRRATYGYGSAAYTPLPTEWLTGAEASSNISDIEDRLAAARTILEEGGWTRTDNGRWEKEIDDVNVPLLITIRSANGTLFESMVTYITEVWQSLGVEVSAELYQQSDLVQTVIRPRDYQALVFGTDVGRSLDLYPFWHSSQREDPGLNVSLYANITVDSLVSSVRTATSTEARDGLINEFLTEIDQEQPAIFLFSPSFEYVVGNNIKTTDMERIQRPSERFSNITGWYMNESNVWPIFANN